jgi:hypothetical protein
MTKRAYLLLTFYSFYPPRPLVVLDNVKVRYVPRIPFEIFV